MRGGRSGKRNRDAGVERDLRSRLRATRHKVQVWVVEAGGGGRLSRWTGDPILEEKGDKRVQQSGADQSKYGGWGGKRTHKVKGNEIAIKQLTILGQILV